MLKVADQAPPRQPVAGQTAKSAQSVRGMRPPKFHLCWVLSSLTTLAHEKALIIHLRDSRMMGFPRRVREYLLLVANRHHCWDRLAAYR
jgi:hypothetical protein